MALNRLSLTLCPALVVAALVAAGPAGADEAPAGTVSVSRACYVNTARALAQITVTGSGWEGGSTLELTDKLDRISATATVDAGGRFSTRVPAPTVDSSKGPEISDTITAASETEPGMPSDTGASASSSAFLTTNYAVMQSGDTRDPEARTVFELSGFTPGRTVYAHYLTRAGTLLDTVSFGKPAGACGLRRVETAEYPGGHPQTGSYTVQFDDAARYRALTQPQYRLSFQVRTA